MILLILRLFLLLLEEIVLEVVIIIVKVEVEIVVGAEEYWSVVEVVECATLFFRGSAGATRTVYKSCHTVHFEQFILVGWGDVLKYFVQHFCAHALFYGFQYSEGIGDGRFSHFNHVALLDQYARYHLRPG